MKLRDQFIISNISSCLLIFLLIPVLGCSSSIFPVIKNTPPTPGTFVGTWNLEDSTTSVMDCTTIVTEADSMLKATVSNNNTKEVLFLSGRHRVLTDLIGSGAIYLPTYYDVLDSSSFFGRVDTAYATILSEFDFQFSSGADTLTYTALRAHRLLTIVCARK